MLTRVGTASVFAPQRWAVLACFGSQRKCLSPMYFRGDYDSEAQAKAAIREKVALDPVFRSKYNGWRLSAWRVDAGNSFRVMA